MELATLIIIAAVLIVSAEKLENLANWLFHRINK